MSGTESTPPDPVTRTFVPEVMLACRRFASAQRVGPAPAIEDYLAMVSEPHRAALATELRRLQQSVTCETSPAPHPAESVGGAADPQAGPEAHTEAATGQAPAAPDALPSTDSESGSTASFSDSLEDRDLTAWLRDIGARDALDWRQPADRAGPPGEAPPPIERYRITEVLGEGAYGRVYLAWDEELHRWVAIKASRTEAFTSPDQLDGFLREARLAASLRHPALVTVHDIGRRDDGTTYVVLEYIEGQTLARLLRDGRLTCVRASELMTQIAEGVQHAHTMGLVHRDLKPANILIDQEGKPHVADFGLAIDIDSGRLRTGEIAGTPAYMAPEQARGETHRLDGRTDVWALGVTFYLMLTGRTPFGGEVPQVFDAILGRDPVPPSAIDEAVPRELERICLKCLAKRMSERYASAAALGDDLRHWLTTRPAGQPVSTRPALPGTTEPRASDASIEIVPKGLRCFDSQDAGFFLALLPGPRDRDGLPESIRFWKTRIEATEPGSTFSVGLIYGPSGCGKSSLIRAGILPRLSNRVLRIYIEASATVTEERLLARLRNRCPALPSTLALPETLAAIRRGQFVPSGRKVLLVVDQFEQWLHARPEAGEELTQALRQCDGRRLQCILIVRDDFWMATTRFLRDLEIRLVEGENSAAVDLFEPAHARTVLIRIGQAYGRLPDRGRLTPEQERFLDRSIESLRRPDGTIVPVRLSLFAEMVRRRPWLPATLKAVGGPEGLGVAFLEETLSASTAAPEHRRHERAARLVLEALLPTQRVNIKGGMRSYRELLETSGYADRPAEFDELLHILDSELRLVSPRDAAAQSSTESGSFERPETGLRDKFYQLTHDELVPSLRQWLRRRQSRTIRGRAALRLAARTEEWIARPDVRNLPSWWEWVTSLTLTRHRDWTAAQRRVMTVATRRYAARGAIVTALAAGLTLAGLLAQARFEEHRQAREAAVQVATLLVAKTGQLPHVIQELEPYGRWANPALHAIVNNAESPAQHRLHATLALHRQKQVAPDALVEPLLVATPEELRVIREELTADRGALDAPLWSVARDPEASREKRFRAACALAGSDPAGAAWPEIAGPVVAQLVAENPLLIKEWVDLLRPARGALLPPLSAVFRKPGGDGTERMLATSILTDYAADNPEQLAALLGDAETRQFLELFPIAAARSDRVEPRLREMAERRFTSGASEDQLDLESRRRANAATALYRLSEPDAIWPLLETNRDPRLQSDLIHALHALEADPGPLITALATDRDAGRLRALALALSNYGTELPESVRNPSWLGRVVQLYREHPDPGVHGAIRHLLQTLGLGERAREVDVKLSGTGPVADRDWFVDDWFSYVVLDPSGKDPLLSSFRKIDRVFAVADREVTIEQYHRFRSEHRTGQNIARQADCPAGAITWFDAAAFCRWLDEREGVPEAERCFPSLDQIKPGMILPADHLKRTGHRLPTFPEWEYACRGGTVTPTSIGNRPSLLLEYDWCAENSERVFHPVGSLKPNPFGLFDMNGNAGEWCLESVAHSNSHPARDVEDLTPVMGDGNRWIRGFTFETPAAEMRSDHLAPVVPGLLWDGTGFRVVRTVRALP